MFELPLKQKKRQVLHIDADAFFASVEQVLNPNLRGKPILVGGPSENHGIVSTASYEAKKFGIYSGMPLYLAKKKCPQAIVVQGHFEAYRDFSRRMYKIFTNYTLKVEMASIDEAYLDLTGYSEFFGRSEADIARSISMDIYKELGISVSCGLGSNKTVAKVASSINKPHKITIIPFGKEAEFLAPLSLKKLPGVGPKTFAMLEKCGFQKVGEIAALSIDEILRLFGIQGIPIWKKCLGINNHDVVPNASLPKSISKEKTLYQSVRDKEYCLKVLRQLGTLVFAKLRAHGMKAKMLFMKIRYKGEGERERGQASFRDFSFQKDLGVYSSADSDFFEHLEKLFEEHYEEDEPVRLLGVGVGHLVENYNLDLFAENRKKDQLFGAIDRVQGLYGEEALRYGGYVKYDKIGL